MKKIINILICIILILPILNIKAKDERYFLYNSSFNGLEIIEEYNSLNEAYRYYNRLVDEYDNLVLMIDDEVVLMEYGIVEFKVNDTCTLNIDYDNNYDKQATFNPCYAIDAAYLNTDRNFKEVSFKLSDSVNTTSIDNVILHPFETLLVKTSKYSVNDGILNHEIKSQLLTEHIYSKIILGEINLNDGEYYSYDGHYFYDDFYLMIDDYKDNIHDNALNTDAYYNYYMYLPHRSLTNYSSEEINDYFYNTLVFNNRLDGYVDFNFDNANDDVNRSQYVSNIDPFFEYQNLYGANAMMMLSISMNESSFGKSKSAYSQNNLFGHAAFSSKDEIAYSRYDSVASSISSHAKYYISSRFANPKSVVYNGSFFGNLNSGMNLYYSNDPYWGEKVASYYRNLDNQLGQKDKDIYALGISENNRIEIYKDEKLEEKILDIDNIGIYSFILLEETNDYYKVQLDLASDEENYYYDFTSDIAYIKKDIINQVINKDSIKENKYYNITFDLGDYSKIVKVKEGDIPTINKPQVDFKEFIGFDKELEKANKDTTYKAIYKDVIAIDLIKKPDKLVVEEDGLLSLAGAKLKVTYLEYDEIIDEEVKKSEIIDLNTDMIENFDLKKDGPQTIIIHYAGHVTSFEIEVSSKLKEERLRLDEQLPKLIDDYLNNKKIDINKVFEIKEMIKNTDYILSNEQVTYLDKILLDTYSKYINFNIDSGLDLAISGMALTLDYQDSYKDKLIPDTYYVETGVTSIKDENYIEKVSSAYGLKKVLPFSLNFRKNGVKVDAQLPFLVEIKFDNLDTKKIYTVYHVDDDGDVIKCRTTQSKEAIEFSTVDDGDFMILALDSENDYAIETKTVFNLNSENDDIDLNAIILEIIGLIILVLLNMILFVNSRLSCKKREVLWNDYKKSWRNVVLPQEEKRKN